MLCREEVLFKSVHEKVGILGGEASPHSRAVCLDVVMTVESEVVVVEDEAYESSDVVG